MNTRTILTLLVVVGMVVPAAGIAVTAQTNSTPTPAEAGSATGQDASGSTAANYTRLYVHDRYKHLELKPGEEETITVTVENGEDEEVELSPSVHIPPRGERPIEKSWVSIQADDTTLDAGEEREFEVTVSVPDDAELNRYGGAIAFTDERITYPGRPPQPVHAVSLNVEVWREPTVRVLSDRHVYTQVKAGDSFTREIVVENTGDGAVPVNPQLNTEDRHHHRYPDDRETLDRSWVAIDAPSEIAPGETATIEVTVSAPDDAERGDYHAELDLGLKDPARPERSSYWQQVSLSFQVWTQPEEPFETDVQVSDEAESLELELSAGRHRDAGDVEPPSFDVTFVSPNGTEIDAERVRVTDRGHVDLGEDRRRSAADDSTYAAGGEHRTFRYRLDDPAAGSWSVKIMPENTMRFGYEIIRNERG